MLLSLLGTLAISLLTLPTTPAIVSENDVIPFSTESNASVGSAGISVSLENDDVPSGSLISAVFTMPDSTEDLSISSYSDGMTVSLTDNEDGTFTTDFRTNRTVGEFSICLSLSSSLSIDSDSSEATSLYIYSDGINDCVSYCSIDEARAKYYANHVATEEELVLLGKKDAPDNFSPSLTKYQAESNYADATYKGRDIVTGSATTSGDFSNKIRVEGSAIWYDENEISHPLRGVLAVLWDDDIFWDEYCGYEYTDEEGCFSFEINSETFLGLGGRDLFVTLYSASKATSVGSFWWGTYIYCTPKFVDIRNNSKIVYNIEMHPGLSDRANAFEICDAQKIPHDYLSEMAEINLPPVVTYYPAFNGDGCYYNSVLNYIAVGWQFYRDWDCLNHEYGHYINKKLNLCDCGVGGAHNVGDDLISDHGKIDGMKLAMSEGLASYLGTAAQIYFADGYAGYPRVGDERYDSFSGAEADYGEYCYGGSRAGCGEGNEFSITSFLVKILDDVPREGDDVGLGHKTMWTAISSSRHAYISELVCTILAQNASQRSAIGRILELEGYSPIAIDAPNLTLSVENKDPSWTFSWAGNGLLSGRPNQFTLTFEGSSGDSYSIENVSGTSLTLNESQMNSVLALSGACLKWYVTGYNTDIEVTGGYVTSDSFSAKPSASILSLNSSCSSELAAGKTKWFRFTAPYEGTYHFESTSNLDLHGEAFSSFVVDKSSQNSIANDDDGGDNQNFKLSVDLSSGQTVYLRVRGYNYNSNVYGSFSIATTVDHVHSYKDHFLTDSSTKHRAYCSCGAYSLMAHTVNAESVQTYNGRRRGTCADCGASVDMGSTIVLGS